MAAEVEATGGISASALFREEGPVTESRMGVTEIVGGSIGASVMSIQCNVTRFKVKGGTTGREIAKRALILAQFY